MTEVLLGTLEDFPEGDCRVLAVGDFELGVFRVDGRVVAWENQCPHFQGPVCQGRLFNKVEETILADGTSAGLAFGSRRHVICPWHGYEFDIETGRHPGDTRYRLRSVDVTLRGQEVWAVVP
jgi:nitrite reductase (NADH) small subunit